MKIDKRLLHICKVEYIQEHANFQGHIKNVNYWYRRLYNSNRGKSATERYLEKKSEE